MTLENFLITLLQTANEILASATVIIAVSLLLYNLTRNFHNRVSRTSGFVLACVTWAYTCDVFLSLNLSPTIAEATIRLQWLGLAFIPATMFHLSDALLTLTGRFSRGRRRRVIRIFYLTSMVFFLTATLSDVLITPVTGTEGTILQAQSLLPLYVFYFLGTNITAFINVQRARQRCLTGNTRRRMAYLQIAILTPPFAIFPYSVLLPVEEAFSLPILLLVNIANIIVVAMLIFLSYPLSFFGSDRPDRVVKVELLRFLLRGPGTGLLALAMIIVTTRATRILSLPGEDLTPFAVVAIVLLWQWTIAIILPRLEAWWIYNDEEDSQLAHLQDLGDRLLTRSDLSQLLQATLEAACEYLRVETAFILLTKHDNLEIISRVGEQRDEQMLESHSDELQELINHISAEVSSDFHTWGFYQVMGLYNHNQPDNPVLIGLLAVQATPIAVQLQQEEHKVIRRYVERAEQTLKDILLQQDIFAALEGLLPQITMTRTRAGEVIYRNTPETDAITPLPSGDELYEQVRAALRHYWGGPGITRSRLMELRIVQENLAETDTPVQALRDVIKSAVEKLRPEGQRSMTEPEWTFYNIIDMRYLEGKKVKDVARRMSMSEGDLYRKQRRAIEAVAASIITMEKDIINNRNV